MRLNKALAQAGIASRRAVEEIIFAGRVFVNKERCVLPQTIVDPEVDTITVDRKKVKMLPMKRYFLVHKPLGYICTSAVQNKRRVIDLIDPEEKGRFFTVGRLDKETSGLIIVTNDGDFAHKVMHPSFGIKKEYIAKIDKEITDEHLKQLSQGCLVEGVRVVPHKVQKVRKATIRIVVNEGRHHEVRVLLESIGATVRELKRTKIGNLSLGKIPAGGYKSVSEEEAEAIFD